MHWSLYQTIQRLRRRLGLAHDVVERESHGSGSVQVIPPPSPEASRGTVSLKYIEQRDRFKTYDPVKYRPSDVPYGGVGVTRELNRICSKTGLQMTVCMDPSDFKQVYHFKNVSKTKLVRVRWISDKQNHEVLLEPDEQTTIKVDHSLDSGYGYPEIKAFEYGQQE